jgi:hypothetical protein
MCVCVCVLCLHVLMQVCMHVSVNEEHAEEPHMLFFSSCLPCIMQKSSLTGTWGHQIVRLTVQWVPIICLLLPPQSWDWKCVCPWSMPSFLFGFWGSYLRPSCYTPSYGELTFPALTLHCHILSHPCSFATIWKAQEEDAEHIGCFSSD